jgi:hypothetical protein
MVQLRQEYRTDILKHYVKHLPARLHNLSLFSALKILSYLGDSDIIFYWDAFPHQEFTAETLIDYMPSDYPAADVTHIQFVGGPESRLAIFRGNFLQFVLDRLFNLIDIEGNTRIPEILTSVLT